MAGKPKLTVEDINNKLSNRYINLIGNYVNNSFKTNFLCLLCNNKWEAQPKLVLRGTGCPTCDLQKRRKGSLTKSITNEEIDSKLLNTDIKRLGHYIGVKEKLLWECIKCGHNWNATTNNIFHRKTGCPKCSAKSKGLRFRNSILWIQGTLINE